MATRLVFEDENNEMECYLNTERKLFISVKDKEDENFNGYITLDKEDITELIQVLKNLEKEMED